MTTIERSNMDDSSSSLCSLNESGMATTRQRLRPSPSDRPSTVLRSSLRRSSSNGRSKRPFSTGTPVVEFAEKAVEAEETSESSLSSSSSSLLSVVDLTFLSCFWGSDEGDAGCGDQDYRQARTARKRHRLTVPIVALMLVVCLLGTMHIAFPENGAGRWIVANLEAAAKRKKLSKRAKLSDTRRRAVRKEPVVYSAAPPTACRRNAIVYFVEHVHEEYPHLLKSLSLLDRQFLQQQKTSDDAQILIFHLGRLTQSQMYRAESHFDNPVAGLTQWIDISHTKYYSKGRNTFWAHGLWDYLRDVSRRQSRSADDAALPYYLCTYKYVLLMQPGTYLHTPLEAAPSSFANGGDIWGHMLEERGVQLGYRLCLVQQQDVHQHHHLYTQQMEWIQQLWSAYPYTQTLVAGKHHSSCAYPDLRHFTALHVPTIQGSRSISKLWKWMWERDIVEDLPLNVVLNTLWGSILVNSNSRQQGVIQFHDFGLQGMEYTYHPHSHCIKDLEGMVQAAGSPYKAGTESGSDEWVRWTEEEVILPAHQNMICSSHSSRAVASSFLVVDQVMQHMVMPAASAGGSNGSQRPSSEAVVSLRTLYLSTKSHTELEQQVQSKHDGTLIDLKQWSTWSRKMLEEDAESVAPYQRQRALVEMTTTYGEYQNFGGEMVFAAGDTVDTYSSNQQSVGHEIYA